jgi:hypothetical protein
MLGYTTVRGTRTMRCRLAFWFIHNIPAVPQKLIRHALSRVQRLTTVNKPSALHGLDNEIVKHSTTQ